jgi:hypothetical protein
VEHEVGGGDKTAFLGVQAKNYALAKMLKIHNVSEPILVTWNVDILIEKLHTYVMGSIDLQRGPTLPLYLPLVI